MPVRGRRIRSGCPAFVNLAQSGLKVHGVIQGYNGPG